MYALEDLPGDLTQPEAHRKASSYEFCKDVFGRLPNRDDLYAIDTDLTNLLIVHGKPFTSQTFYWSGSVDDMARKTYYALTPEGASSVDVNTVKHKARAVLDVF